MTQNSTPSTGETATPSTAEASYPLISVAIVPTERAARYGKQLVSHMAHKITGSWDEEAGSGYLLFDREGPVLGRFDVVASASDLRLELRTEPERADRLEFIVGIHLARFGARDSLAISWERTDGSEGSTQGPSPPKRSRRTPAPRRQPERRRPERPSRRPSRRARPGTQRRRDEARRGTRRRPDEARGQARSTGPASPHAQWS